MVKDVRVHLLRHGETQNPDKIVYGLRDFSLTDDGIRQAREAGQYLTNFSPEMVSSSPVLRAMETAFTAGSEFEELVPFFIDGRLTEAISMFDGERVPEVASKRSSWSRLTNPFGPSWGEPYAFIAERMDRAVQGALSFGAEDVVLVSHQLPIWVYRLHVEGRAFAHDPAARQCGHASVTTFTFRHRMAKEIHYWENTFERISA